MRNLFHFLGLGTLCAWFNEARCKVIPRQDAGSSVVLNTPSSPPENAQTVDAAFVSYSFEFPNWVQYAGNSTHPNKFSYQLMENLRSISGELPYVRIGGTPQDIVEWNSSQKEAQIAVWPNNDLNQNPTGLSLGPSFVDSFGGFPKDTKYIFGLTFGSVNASGLQNTLMEAKAVFDALQGSLYAFEIGNEPEYYITLRLRPSNWSVFQYVPEWEEFANAIAEYDFGPAVNERIEPIFQAGALQAPLGINNISIWNAQSLLELGIANAGQVKSFSEHQYMGAASSGSLETLLNRTVMTSQMYYHQFLSTYTVGQGYKYVLGETNTMSGHGLNGVSNALAAALWSIDYALYSACLNVSRVHYHSGTVFRYSAWQPIDVNSTSLHKVLPLYYGNLFTAHVFAGGDKQIAILVNETYFAAYGVYNLDCLESIVAIDTNVVNATIARAYSSVTIPGVDLGRAVVRRLTAPSSDAQTNVTLAGQTVNTDGYIVGDAMLERATNGQILLGSSEAVIISL